MADDCVYCHGEKFPNCVMGSQRQDNGTHDTCPNWATYLQTHTTPPPPPPEPT